MPPPPPPPPPPLLAAPISKPLDEKPVDRNALLSQIRQGKNLKKASTNDKSAPFISAKKGVTLEKGPQATGHSNNINSIKNGPIGMGDLFSQGMPKLRSTNKAFMEGGRYKSQLNPRQIGSSSLSSKSGEGLGTLLKTNNYQEATSQTKPAEIKQNGLLNNTSMANNKFIATKITKTEFSGMNFKPKRPMLPQGQKPTISSLKYGQNNISEEGVKFSGSNPELVNEVTKHSELNKPQLPSKYSLSLSTLPVKSKTVNIEQDNIDSLDLKDNESYSSYESENTDCVDSNDAPKKQFNPSFTNELAQKFNANKDINWGGSVPDLANENTAKFSVALKPPLRQTNLSLSTSALIPKHPQSSMVKSTEGISTSVKSAADALNQKPHNLNRAPEGQSNHPKPPVRQNRKAKPSVAPPPVPTRLPQQMNSRTVSKTLSPSVPPPPPPPRTTSQVNTMDNRHSSTQRPATRAKLESKLLNGSKGGQMFFEDRFLAKFHMPEEFPKPGTFSREQKTYLSKSAKNRKPNTHRHHRPTTVPPPPPPALS